MRPELQSPPMTEHAAEKMQGWHQEVVGEVREAVSKHDLVVVGMAQNPHVKRARKALDEAGIAYEYLEFGSYLSQWRPRLALKLWSGWPTFPQVYLKGTLIGGANETQHMLKDGSLRQRLGEASAAR